MEDAPQGRGRRLGMGAAPSRPVALVIGIVVTFLWATSVVLVRAGLTDEDLPPLGFAGVRFSLAALILLVIALPRLRSVRVWSADRRSLLGAAAYGLLIFCLAQAAFVVALGELTAATVGLLLGWPRSSRRPSPCAVAMSAPARSSSMTHGSAPMSMMCKSSTPPRGLPMKTCSVEGCDKPHHARGYCDSHNRWSRDNDWAEPDYPLPVYYGGRRYRPMSTAYNRSGDEGPPPRRGAVSGCVVLCAPPTSTWRRVSPTAV